MDRKDFEAGIILGLCLPPVPQVVRTPVAYSYNGVILPKLPEWDRSAYPYEMIQDGGYGGTQVILRVFAGYEVSGDSLVYTEAMYCTSFNGGAWSVWTEHNGGTLEKSEIIWSGFDAKGEDGSLFFEGSQPVPVYE